MSDVDILKHFTESAPTTGFIAQYRASGQTVFGQVPAGYDPYSQFAAASDSGSQNLSSGTRSSSPTETTVTIEKKVPTKRTMIFVLFAFTLYSNKLAKVFKGLPTNNN